MNAEQKSLLTAAKCALADLEGAAVELDIDTRGDEPMAKTIRELRAAIPAVEKLPAAVEIPLETANGLLCLYEDRSRAEAYAEELAALEKAVESAGG